jgi:hypothetical protein
LYVHMIWISTKPYITYGRNKHICEQICIQIYIYLYMWCHIYLHTVYLMTVFIPQSI